MLILRLGSQRPIHSVSHISFRSSWNMAFYRVSTVSDPNRRTHQPIKLIIDHLKLSYYRYEVTLPLYVMTTTEKIIFNSIMLILLGLLVTATTWYLPAFLFRRCQRIVWYAIGDVGPGAVVGNGTILHRIIE